MRLPSAYRSTIDTVDLFIRNAAEKDNEAEPTKTSEVYLLYREWCMDNKFPSVSAQAFVGRLRSMGYVKRNTKEGNVLQGLRIKSN